MHRYYRSTGEDGRRVEQRQALRARARRARDGHSRSALRDHSRAMTGDAPCEGMCAVCFDAAGGAATRDADEVVSCDSCGVCVHRSCYGVHDGGGGGAGVTSAEGGLWQCDRCAAVEGARAGGAAPATKCALCPRIGGAYKRVHGGRQWVHVFCALQVRAWRYPFVYAGICISEYAARSCGYAFAYTVDTCPNTRRALQTPGVAFLDAEGMCDIDISRVPRGHWRLSCYLCKRPGGACVQCAQEAPKSCYRPFHALCAQMAECYCGWAERRDGGTIVRSCYCRDHAPEGCARDTHVQFRVICAPLYVSRDRVHAFTHFPYGPPICVSRMRRYSFDAGARRWVRALPVVPEDVARLIAVRREFERARILADRVVRREKLKRSCARRDAQMLTCVGRVACEPGFCICCVVRELGYACVAWRANADVHL